MKNALSLTSFRVSHLHSHPAVGSARREVRQLSLVALSAALLLVATAGRAAPPGRDVLPAPAPAAAAPAAAAPPAAAPIAAPAAPPLTPPPFANPYAARRQRQRLAPTFAVDIVRLLDKTFAASYGVARSPTLELGGVFAAGSPDRARLTRFNVTELGAYASWFGMGDRGRGVGLTARARYLYAWGSGETDDGSALSTSAHAGSVSGLITARYTTLGGLRLELQGGLMWLSSRAGVSTEGAVQRSALDTLLTSFSLLVGWTF